MKRNLIVGGPNPILSDISFPIDGDHVYGLSGMIYWYAWGEHEFDIRIIRDLLSLPKETEDDIYFTNGRDRETAFINNWKAIEKALENDPCNFRELIEIHDNLIDAREPHSSNKALSLAPKLRTSPFLPHTLLHAVDAYIEDHPKCRCLVREMADDYEGSATLTHSFTAADKLDLLMTLLSDLEISGCIHGDFPISALLAADGDKQQLAELINTATDEDASA